MSDDGVFPVVGRQIGKASPLVARSALALPAAFGRWASGVLSRLRNEDNFILLLVLGFVIGAGYVYPAIVVTTVLYGEPEKYDVYKFLYPYYADIVGRINRGLTHEEFFLAIVAGLVALTIIPPIVRLYFSITAWVVTTIFQWPIHLFTGAVSHPLTGHKVKAKEKGDDVAGLDDLPNPPIDSAERLTSQPILEKDAVAKNVQKEELLEPLALTAAQTGGTEGSDRAKTSESPPLEENHREMKARLQSLLKDIRSREDTNLGVGILFSVMGVILLIAFIIFGSPPSNSDALGFALWFLPKLTIAIFIQVFAYFFLGLYKANLSDIKYFNNELTNMEYKKLAIDIALNDSRISPLRNKVCVELIKIERNFILKKGETTAHSQREQDEIGLDKASAKKIEKMFRIVGDLAKAKKGS